MEFLTHPETIHLEKELEKLLNTLKNNRDKVPLDVLKSKYRIGYESLCKNISQTSSDYVTCILFQDLRIHKDYLEEIVPLINQVIHESGIMQELTKAAFQRQNLAEFTALTFKLKNILTDTLDSFWGKYTGLYITPECLESSDRLPEFYCFANGCVWHDGKWVPFEQLHPYSMQVPHNDFTKN